MTFSGSGGGGSGALTSLGAVGGPRGTAAGALRLLVQFVTTYDPAGAKALQADLQATNEKVQAQQAQLVQAQQSLATSQTKLNQTFANVGAVGGPTAENQLKGIIKQYQALEGASDSARQKGIVSIGAQVQGLASTLDLTKQQKAQLTDVLKQYQAVQEFTTQTKNRQNELNDSLQVQTALQKENAEAAAVPANLAARAQGLIVGAVGGLLAGAVIGAGFAVVTAGLNAVGEGLLNILDPARQARDELDAVAKSVSSIASSENITGLAAAAKAVGDLGPANFGKTTADQLDQIAQLQKVDDLISQGIQLGDVSKELDALKLEQLKKITDQLIKQDEASGAIAQHSKEVPVIGGPGTGVGGGIVTEYEQVADQAYYAAQAQKVLNDLLGIGQSQLDADAAAAANDAAQKTADARATAYAAVQQQLYNNAVNAGVTAQGAGIDTQIQNLQDNAQPSAKTNAIQAQIDALQNTGSGSQLASIEQQKEVILLRERLTLLGQNINLEKYAGVFLLTAIQAKIDAIQKETQEQDALNAALDLQYQISQGITRNAGETIQDFLARRANEQRDQLGQQADQERQAQVDQLNNMKQHVQDQVDLQNLNQQEQNIAAQNGQSARLKILQKELADSQKNDQAVLQSKIDALNKIKAAEQQAAQDAEQYTSDQGYQQTADAIAAATSLAKIQNISGLVSGLQMSKGEIQGLIDGGLLSPTIGNPMLARIAALLASYDAQFENDLTHSTHRGPVQGFAKGGVFMLNGGMNPFGQNTRVGEQGNEIGVILGNRVASQLKESKGASFGDIVVQGTGDPKRDAYRVKKEVTAALQAAIR